VGETQEQAAGRRDFFVSYTGADQGWAEWIAWELEQAGYSTVLQAWDFVAGTNFAHAMHKAAIAARHTLAVLSPAYLRSRFGEAEWLAAFVTDPLGQGRRLLPVRIEACKPAGLLAGVTYVDLVGLDEAAARARLLEEVAGALRGHRRPPERPRFPAALTPAALDRPRYPTALPPVWNLPWRRNPDFTGREAELAALAAQLEAAPGAVAVTQAQAIQGAGGIGKTSLAVEYAYRHHARFEVVWWLRAQEPASLVGDYAALAAALGLPQAGQADQQQAALAVRGWLAANGRWLLVVDNAPEPAAPTGLAAPLARLVDLLPPVIGGQVLVTSRDARWERDAQLAALDLFTAEEAVRFLLARAGSQDAEAAGKVAELLGYLPLALEQAGAYTREAAISLADYLQRLQRFPELALAKGEPRDRDPADTVAVTWQVSLDRVRPVPGALALLQVCAFLAPEDVPRELLAQPLDPPPEAEGLAALASDPFALDEAVAGLRRYGLVKATEQALGVHQLLQQVVRAGLAPEVAASRAGVAVRLLWAAFPEEGFSEIETWVACERLLPHALAAADHAQQHAAEPAATVWLLHFAAGYLLGRGRYREARPLLDRAVALAEATFGPDDHQTATCLNDLGLLLLRAGYRAAARPVLERALAIYEATLGPDHLAVAAPVDNLGQVLYAQGDLAAARQRYERALAIHEAALGPDHPDVGITLSNLALVLYDQGDLAGARQHMERALAIYEAAQGPNHPETQAMARALAELQR
jgi:tetratricopeptide (TPR) repeat protein